tara:strand:- start:609 stop:779 length:171 start_codon:yes stop_codon:yes gene_type:complete
MKKSNLKKIVQDLKSLLNELESEVYSDPESFVHPWYEQAENSPRRIQFQDDDGYTD